MGARRKYDFTRAKVQRANDFEKSMLQAGSDLRDRTSKVFDKVNAANREQVAFRESVNAELAPMSQRLSAMSEQIMREYLDAEADAAKASAARASVCSRESDPLGVLAGVANERLQSIEHPLIEI